MTNPTPISRQDVAEDAQHAAHNAVPGVSRLAPSPTGALHLGNIRTFLVNWAVARQRGWRLRMRIEDLDGPRVKSEFIQQTLDLLAWVGIDWDGDVLLQSADLSPYHNALEQLAKSGAVYPCELTRSEIDDAASAPHSTAGQSIFPATLRPPGAGEPVEADRADANYRLLIDEQPETVDDALVGRTVYRPSKDIGDFVIWTRRGVPAYQLAVVVDDIRQGVTDVIRGDDLLPSAARQQLICRLLGATPPTWWHLPLVLGRDGRRLAKRHGDTRLASYRASGAHPDRIIGLMAKWCGLMEHPVEMDANEFKNCFRMDAVPLDPVILSAEDEQWLNGD